MIGCLLAEVERCHAEIARTKSALADSGEAVLAFTLLPMFVNEPALVTARETLRANLAKLRSGA